MAHPEPAAGDVLARLAATLVERRSAAPDTSYVAALYAKGDDAILKKIGEEATEVVMAGKDGEPGRIVSEVADLWFHCMVLLARHGLCARRRAGRTRAARRHVGPRRACAAPALNPAPTTAAR